MSEFTVYGFDVLEKQLQSIDSDKICKTCINKAMPILKKNLKKEAKKHKDTGAMQKSIKKTAARKNKYGYFAVTRPTGAAVNRSGQVIRNMDKMMWLEFGAVRISKSGKRNVQLKTPVISPAIKTSESAVLNKMQDTFDQMIKSKI